MTLWDESPLDPPSPSPSSLASRATDLYRRLRWHETREQAEKRNARLKEMEASVIGGGWMQRERDEEVSL